MALRLESRPVGDVLVIQCHGRIVAGNDVFALHAQVGDSLGHHGDVVLQLDGVEFVDSSGLGALVRLLQAARSKGGDLKLSGVPAVLRRSLDRCLPRLALFARHGGRLAAACALLVRII